MEGNDSNNPPPWAILVMMGMLCFTACFIAWLALK